MPKWMTRSFKFIRDLPRRASPRWPWPLRTVRKANITDSERDYFERYGENVVAMMASSGFEGNVEHARAWLTERADSHERREQWISGRDLILDLVIIVLIGWEIRMSYRQERLQSQDFEKQQQVLTNLQSSSAATANTLIALQRTAELTNTTLQEQLDAVRRSEAQAERSAKAGETSASTASQALHVSERAYVHMRAHLTKSPAAGETPQISISIFNSGRTPAVQLTPNSRAIIHSGPPTPDLAVELARTTAFAGPSSMWQSVATLAAGQTEEVPITMPRALTQAEFDELIQGKAWLYIFAIASYKDVFQQVHNTEICSIYYPALKFLGDCHEHNKSD
jgi:cytoskeletal protein RodZ